MLYDSHYMIIGAMVRDLFIVLLLKLDTNNNSLAIIEA